MYKTHTVPTLNPKTDSDYLTKDTLSQLRICNLNSEGLKPLCAGG